MEPILLLSAFHISIHILIVVFKIEIQTEFDIYISG